MDIIQHSLIRNRRTYRVLLGKERKMTREEAIEVLKHTMWKAPNEVTAEKILIATDMAIQALSQEPCDDAISREDAINIASLHCLTIDETVKALERLPSVTQKSGKWIDYRDEGFVECPFCGHATNCEDDIDELHYCFYCGAKMESEDKE